MRPRPSILTDVSWRAAALLLAALSCAPARAALPLKPDTDPALRAAGARALLAGALALTATGAGLWWLRRRMDGAPPRGRAHQPALRSSHRVGRRTVLLVVQWEGRRYLLAEGGGGTRLLDSRAVEDTP